MTKICTDDIFIVTTWGSTRNSEKGCVKMADFDKIVRKYTNDDGNIPADSIPSLVQGISKAVGEGFVTLDRYNAKKNLADELQTKLDEAGEQTEKYNKLKTEYDAYKNDVEAKALRSEKENAYREMLKEIGIPEKRLAVILKTVNFDELDFKDGKFTDIENIKKTAKEEWSDFIVTVKETGVDSATPPENNGGKEKPKSRALELAQRYQEQMYGKVEEKK